MVCLKHFLTIIAHKIHIVKMNILEGKEAIFSVCDNTLPIVLVLWSKNLLKTKCMATRKHDWDAEKLHADPATQYLQTLPTHEGEQSLRMQHTDTSTRFCPSRPVCSLGHGCLPWCCARRPASHDATTAFLATGTHSSMV